MKLLSLFIVILGCVVYTALADANDDLIKQLNPEPKPKYIITLKQKTPTGGKVDLGKIIIETFPQIAPKHCHNFDSLVKIGFYNGLKFHKIVPDFIMQGGDPNTKDGPRMIWGRGRPDLVKVEDEFSKLSHQKGVISQARKGGPNSGSTQFFICLGDASKLDGEHSIWGRVLQGLELLDKLMTKVSLTKSNPDSKEAPNMPLYDIEMEIQLKLEE